MVYFSFDKYVANKNLLKDMSKISQFPDLTSEVTFRHLGKF